MRRREVDLDALRQTAREGASPAVVLDQADDVAMRLQGHFTQVEQAGLHCGTSWRQHKRSLAGR